MKLPLHKILKNGATVELDYIKPQEYEDVRRLLNVVIDEGQTYPQKQPLSQQEFAAYWLSQDAFVIRLSGEDGTQKPQTILGSFYIKPNFPGRCSHICNAGFIVQPGLRGQGIGKFMGESMLLVAAQLGYEAVMFNLVFETNIPSITLWQSLGFDIIGSVPDAAKLADGKVVKALIMYRALGV
ncbi:N-acetyltransferase family protein [Anabaena sp. FACHB-709]|uniref:GNAT family N-acetyltransferase n=2 Tax=Nostocaceae TaxID=1162 RepID=A0ABR7ZLP9_ANACY|nr:MULTISPECIES: GNAT family N-acetyltransferase [Nostocaceae]BAY70011.1 putative acetyltransferase [Trichormus variabilis NIES-23]HBW32159.1 N-acetyltransferase [Nostoc sp. UBA8866]MBD2173534.1 GNAT family N-acetyltransferase [Anabaena cylindrica FACHB-318]MBD2265387.1 GNAT family N-acetyltransferase [Anabaena sp. FACHB-709]MBD2275661.1 GNAT family N-acetyltransferase [Nostoc sp. PCC 7120 = FACHB-418]